MSVTSFFERFAPQYKKAFYPLLEKAAGNASAMALLLQQLLMLRPLPQDEELLSRITAQQQVSSAIKREVFLQLGKNFITPFEREDIHELAYALDNISDYINQAALRVNLHKPEPTTEAVYKLTELLLDCTRDLETAVSELENMSLKRRITDSCTRINRIEKEADYIYRKTVAAYFSDEQDVSRLIRMMDILSALESAINSCKTTAVLIECILIKNH